MIATQVKQKESVFYFVSYPAEDILNKVKFTCRYYYEGEEIKPEKNVQDDEIASFISKVESSDRAFQRRLSAKKVKEIKNFYETSGEQPIIPGCILLFTSEKLEFTPLDQYESVGNLSEPKDKYLIIDGQHRLAALEFYKRHHPQEIKTVRVPCIIFDGKSENFAAEMFVIINTTPTRITKGHLIELLENVTWFQATQDKKIAAKVTKRLYSDYDSPMRYKINKPGGRSKQDKWIIQAELFNEIHRWTKRDMEVKKLKDDDYYYTIIRDFIKAAIITFGDYWENKNYMLAVPIVIKSLIRIASDWATEYDSKKDMVSYWCDRFEGWKKIVNEFRKDGFYERFPAKGQIERVQFIVKKLKDNVK